MKNVKRLYGYINRERELRIKVRVLCVLCAFMAIVSLAAAWRFCVARDAAQYWQTQYLTGGKGDGL